MKVTNDQKDKAKRLFEYLKGISELKTPLVRDLNKYESVLFFNEVQDEEKCHSPLHSKDNSNTDIWLEIKKPSKPQKIFTPIELISWLANYDFIENEKPILLETIANPVFNIENNDNEEPELLYISDYPQITKIFEEYYSVWEQWYEEVKKYNVVQEIYDKLFSIHQSVKKMGEQIELVVATGLLNWKTSGNQLIHRHILVKKVELHFDSDKGIFTVVPSSSGELIEIEQDMLEVDNRLDLKMMTQIKESLLELEENFWDEDVQFKILRSFVQSISSEGGFNQEFVGNYREFENFPVVNYSPALILRKRSEKGFQKACSLILEQIEQENTILPQGIFRIFEEINDFIEVDKHNSNINLENEEIYFPLLANDEQKQIITNFKSRDGVLVQGPPGTGKTHTIANLVSHLLATGQRVLITSQTARALKVLKGNLPEELRALCVSLLGSDAKSFKDLEEVVQGISNKKEYWVSNEAKKQIKTEEENLQLLREKQANIQFQLRSIREKETFKHQIVKDKYEGTAQNIANILHKNSLNYIWFKDSIGIDRELKVTKAELIESITLLEKLNDEIKVEIETDFPDYDLMLPKEKFEELTELENSLIEKKNELSHFNNPFFNNYSTSELNDLVNFSIECQLILNNLTRKNVSWINNALIDLVDSKFLLWESFYKELDNKINQAEILMEHFNNIDIQGINRPRQQVISDANALKNHLLEGNGFGFWIFKNKVIKESHYIIDSVRVNGAKCDTIETLEKLIGTLELDDYIESCKTYIQQQMEITIPEQPSRLTTLVYIGELVKPFVELIQLKNIIDSYENQDLLNTVIENNKIDSLNYKKTINEANLIISQRELDELNNIFNSQINFLKQFDNTSHEVVQELLSSFKNRDFNSYNKALTKLVELDELVQSSKRCEMLMNKVKESLPKLYESILINPEPQIWESRLNNISDAFDYGKANTWLKEFLNRSEWALSSQLNETEEKISNTIKKLCELKSWDSSLSKMTDKQSTHLIAWSVARRKAGKQTGKNAPKHLRDARKHMDECRDAIPAWIMPLYQVFDNFEIKPNIFDVVIIDEASQSGPEAVILQYLAKKLIVVGDDKQISPEYVGINRDKVEYLRKEYISDFKLGDLLDIENSFFDLANSLFRGRITLREHFRCMPEIIGFSNKISYSNTPLIPLKQYPPNRLEPIITRHIQNGNRIGKGQKIYNEPEAKAITEEVINCIAKPEYDGKTFGIISLQGEGQAKKIESMLLKQIGAEEFEKRSLICGDSYAFQGDERDVIFISLVAAPGDTGMRALTSEKDRRRFNVAVSRAKEQLWLFHTPTVNDFKNKECLRYQLITYCENPDQLELISNREKCESVFEKDVFDQIVNRGYKVIPQYEVSGFRIDMIIEGTKGRIAVECDGDHWHGPDRYEYDMNRQRMLERCGWTFWRVRGSDYYFNPEQAMESLWRLLDMYGLNQEDEGTVTSITEINESFNFQNDKVETGYIVHEHEQISLFDDEELTKVKQMCLFDDISNDLDLDSNTLEESNVNHTLTKQIKSKIAQTYPYKDNDEKKITKDVSNSNFMNLIEYFSNNGFEVIDKREKGGSLWIVGGDEIKPYINQLQKKKVKFSYSQKGGKATKNRPSWFTKDPR
ncbi:AAA domain-containing protein [Gottfriedia sp. S16(2024)]|uniref:AAA domain-containing protein n=1 Tax=Gottfriedia sp. S16(2024) TaxID=3162883 RepID=UPI003D23A321